MTVIYLSNHLTQFKPSIIQKQVVTQIIPPKQSQKTYSKLIMMQHLCQYIYIYIYKTNRQECYGMMLICDANTHNIIPGYIRYPIKKANKQNNSHNSINQYLLILAGSEPKYHAIRLRTHSKSQDRACSKAQL